MFNIDQTLLVRALNSTRTTYPASYVGLRLIGIQLPKGSDQYLQNILIRRLNSGDLWRYKEFKLYKGTTSDVEGDVHEYRNCLAPSPLTAIAESLVLATLAANPKFKTNERVFSYLWPSSKKSGASYEFFADGYKRRNKGIAEKLKDPNNIAVVTDIKSFYPSADKEQVIKALSELLLNDSQELGAQTEVILEFYKQLISRSENGIPVGCASGHALGHIVLRHLDSELTRKYGDCYFRYVDDIVVVCRRKDELYVRQHIMHCVESNGFLLNQDKTLIFDFENWQRYIMQSDTLGGDDFRSYANDMAVYLALHPKRSGALKDMLFDSGLRIPIDKLKALSTYSRFKYFLAGSKYNKPVIVRNFFSSNEDFLRRGVAIKNSHEKSLDSLAEESIETAPAFRRLQVQRIRRVLNATFYLRDFNDWSGDEVFNQFPELVEQRALAKALSSGNADSVLPFFGRGPAAFAELWNQYGGREAKLEKSINQFNYAEIDSIASLKLHGVLSSEELEKVCKINDSRLLRIVSHFNSSARTSPDLSFEDEFESLCLGSSSAAISELANTRHSLEEGATLDALSLMSTEYRS